MANHPAPRSKFDNGRASMPVLDRIRRNVVIDPVSGCWVWQGTVDAKWGYGKTFVGSRRDGTRRSAKAHRAAWEAVNGPVPEAMTLDHFVCDNPPCCNPEHLRLATMRENTLRSETSPTAVNARKEHCGKCGGPLTSRRSGGRVCRPCLLVYYREYNAKRNA